MYVGFHKKIKGLIFARSQSFNFKTVDDKTIQKLEKKLYKKYSQKMPHKTGG